MKGHNHNNETITVAVAGRKGGLSCLRTKGRKFYCQIGRKGQVAMRQKYPNMAKQWGKQGGRPKKPVINIVNGGERQIKLRGGIADPPLS